MGYTGTSLIRNRPPLGSYSRPMPRVLGGSSASNLLDRNLESHVEHIGRSLHTYNRTIPIADYKICRLWTALCAASASNLEFRGGLVSEAHRLCVSPNSRLESKNEEEEEKKKREATRRLG